MGPAGEEQPQTRGACCTERWPRVHRIWAGGFSAVLTRSLGEPGQRASLNVLFLKKKTHVTDLSQDGNEKQAQSAHHDALRTS